MLSSIKFAMIILRMCFGVKVEVSAAATINCKT